MHIALINQMGAKWKYTKIPRD